MAVLFLTALVPAAVMAATLGLERLEHHLLRPAPASDSDATTVRAVLLLLLRLWESLRAASGTANTERVRNCSTSVVQARTRSAAMGLLATWDQRRGPR
jgi:hypothetical protein